MSSKHLFSERATDSKQNWFSGCRKDDVLKIFVEDLDRVRTARLEDGELRIAMAVGEGIMFFKQK
jgi:hypothetical protein